MARNVNPKVSLSIQSDLCGMCAYVNCENVTRDQYKLIKSLSTLDNNIVTIWYTVVMLTIVLKVRMVILVFPE